MAIAKRLASFFDEKRKEELPPLLKEQGILEVLEKFVSGGKLIRGTLFLFMSEALEAKNRKKLINIACALELTHSGLLIQDDIIDKDEMRRGELSIHANFAQKGEREVFDPYHYGVSTALMTADTAFFLASELLANYQSANLPKLLKYYAHEIYLVSLAEGADSIFGQTIRNPGKEEIYSLYKFKTARYTFTLPLELAAIVAGSSLGTRNILGKMGEDIGIIFQIKDDEIGLFGDEKLTGKPVGGDMRENKKTLIRSLLFERANVSDKKILNSCFGNTKSGDAQMLMVKEIYKKYNIDRLIDGETGKLMEKVWEEFEKLEIGAIHKKMLKEFLEMNIHRTV